MTRCLATLWFPDLNPVSFQTIWVISWSVFFIICLQLSRKSGKLAGVFIILSLLGPLVMSVFTYGTLPNAIVFGGRMFPDADEIVSGFIYLAFGFGMCLSVINTFPLKIDKVIGILCMMIYTGLIALNIWVWGF